MLKNMYNIVTHFVSLNKVVSSLRAVHVHLCTTFPLPYHRDSGGAYAENQKIMAIRRVYQVNFHPRTTCIPKFKIPYSSKFSASFLQ